MSGERKCALCGEDLEGDFFIFKGCPVCPGHKQEVEEHNWEPVGHYRREHIVNHRKNFILRELNKVLILRINEPEEGFRLLVPHQDRKKACRLIAEIFDRLVTCPECLAEFHENEVSCPMCGGRRRKE